MDENDKKKILEALQKCEGHQILKTNDPHVVEIFQWFCGIISEIENGEKIHLSCYKIMPNGIERFDIGILNEKVAISALIPYISELFGVKLPGETLH